LYPYDIFSFSTKLGRILGKKITRP
jgi:hypothetical protein